MERTISKIPIVFEENTKTDLEKVKYIMRQSDYYAYFLQNEVALYLNQDHFDDILQNNIIKQMDQEDISTCSSDTQINLEHKNIFIRLIDKLFNKNKPIKIQNENNPIANNEQISNNILKFIFNNCNEQSNIVVEEQLPYHINYIKGNNIENWIQNKPAFTKLKQKNIYNGIDIIYYEKESKLCYDFIINKNANPKDINFSINGISNIEIDEKGNINILKNTSIVIIKKPETYQIIDGKKIEIPSKYQIKNNNITFEIGDYDTNEELIIDPSVEHVNIIGGNKEDSLEASAIDDYGNIYTTGKTLSTDYPLLNSPNQSISYDTFIVKLNKDGDTVYSARIGGTSDDEATSIAVDNEGNIYITGKTASDDYPLLNEIQGYSGGLDVFITKLKIEKDIYTNIENGTLLFSTYLGGKYDECANSLGLDSNNNLYITGYTKSSNFPKSNINDVEINSDIFITKIEINDNDPSQNKIIKSILLGGEGIGNFIRLGINNNIYVVGEADTSSLPLYNEIYEFNGEKDIYVIKLGQNMNIKFATYLNNGKYNAANALAVDNDQNIYITGYYMEDDNYYKHVCIYRIDKWGEITLQKTLVGNREEEGMTINVDKYNNIYVGGYTTSSNFPTVNSCIRYNIGQYGFLTKLDQSGNILFSTYTGKSDSNTVLNDINLDFERNIYISGNTVASNTSFTRAISTLEQNMFIVKINQDPQSTSTIVEFADINLVASVSKELVTPQEVIELYAHPNETNVVYFYTTDTIQESQVNIAIDSCNNIPAIIESKNVKVTLGIDYKIALVSGKNIVSNLNIFDLVEGYAQNDINYGCLNISQPDPKIDDFKITIEINDMPMTEIENNYVFNLMGKIYVEYNL